MFRRTRSDILPVVIVLLRHVFTLIIVLKEGSVVVVDAGIHAKMMSIMTITGYIGPVGAHYRCTLGSAHFQCTPFIVRIMKFVHC